MFETKHDAAKQPSFMKPIIMLWFLAILGLTSTGFAMWGVWRVVSLSEQFQSKDDHSLVLAVNLKEQIAAFSKLTYDFLLQQDFNRMLMKEKQSNSIRDNITQSLGNLALQSPTGTAGSVIETIRFNVMQFLVLTDKALETSVEEGSAQRARTILQEEVEPALKIAQDSLSTLISSRQKYSGEHFQFLRQQSVMVMFLLIGFAALGMALLLSARMQFLQSLKPLAQAPQQTPTETAATPEEVKSEEEKVKERRKVLEARSLNTLALINRLNRLHKESEDARKIMASLLRHTEENAHMQRHLANTEKDIKSLQMQGDKINTALNRIDHVQSQSKQFLDSMNDLMGNIQALATEGNVVALNVTIEMAKLHAQGGNATNSEKNTKVSDQIRALATTAAGITGRMAMILSQFRYTQEDFTRNINELMNVRSEGQEALEHIRKALHVQEETNAALVDEKAEISHSLPLLNQRLDALEEQVKQIQELANDEVDDITDTTTGRNFKIITGGAA